MNYLICCLNIADLWLKYADVVTAITTIANLIVFIVLTVYVSQLSTKSSREQIMAQNEIILAQFRKAEIDKINESFDKLYHDLNEQNYFTYSLKFLNARFSLRNFENQIEKLFPGIYNDNEIKPLIGDLYIQIGMIYKSLLLYNSFDKWDEDMVEGISHTTTLIIDLKAKLVGKFQNYLLSELKK